MDLDGGNPVPTPSTLPKPPLLSKKGNGASTGPPSSAPSPKPTRGKDAPPPIPAGSGLLTGALFGVEDSATAPGKSAPNIVLHIPLNGQSNKVINFARLAEEKYGFAALHPRLAAQRERLARVAAASAALEKHEKSGRDSAAEDDLSVDVDRDSDGDGDVVMSGTGSANLGPNGASSDTGAAGVGKKKMRKKKIEEYDRDDPFVDDSELAWQEHAVASKDGFFVYSGPLVPEGEKVAVERYYLYIFRFSFVSKVSLPFPPEKKKKKERGKLG
jgi:hypothetical protein